ncbi:MAG: (d)CMP kinase [Oscillospiraceae bacterium]|nr:(d)CMP kinase [Oscillospiraceae bacterium]
MRIAIDGPGGAGKSTAAKLLAEKLKLTYIDTGAMYRAVALKVLRTGFRTDDEGEVLEVLSGLSLKVTYQDGEQNVLIDGENVTGMIRTPEVAKGASDVSAFKGVRLRLVELQREIASGSDVVMDGRDIGTFVFPDAEFKFYLTATEEERARRRYNELKAGLPGLTLEKCLSDLRYRDENDSNREFAPLKKADDAILIDTTDMPPDRVVRTIEEIIMAPCVGAPDAGGTE